jgi:predicted DNA binding CopG/RHH family protein
MTGSPEQRQSMEKAAEIWQKVRDLIDSGQTGQLRIGEAPVAALTTRLSVESLASLAKTGRSFEVIPNIVAGEVQVTIQIAGKDDYYKNLIERLNRGQKDTTQRKRAYATIFGLARAAATSNRKAFETLIKQRMPEILADDPLIAALKEKASRQAMPDEFDLENLQLLGLALFADLPPGLQTELVNNWLDPRNMWQAGDQGT